MNTLSNVIRVSSFLLLISTFSCQTELVEKSDNQLASERITSSYEIVNGIVHFPDDKAFINVVNQFSTLSIAQRAEFGQQQGFKSFLSYYQQELAKYEQLDSLSKINMQRASANSYLTFNNGFPAVNSINSLIAAVTSKDGLVYIGKSVLRFVGNKEVIVKNGDASKALGLVSPADSNVVVIETDNQSPTRSANPHARLITGTCPKLYGQQGDFAVWGDGSRVETTVRRAGVPTGQSDQLTVYFFVKTEGTYVDSGYFDGSSDNNTLRDVYTCDVYDYNNSVVATRSVENYSHSYGKSIVHEDVGINAGQCYSFQLRYYYANFRKGTINPLGPNYPCSLVNCQYSYPIYVTDKHTITADCTN